MCGLSEVDVEGEHGMHRGIVVEVSSGLQACVCGGSASGGGEGAGERESSCIHDFQPLSMPGDKSDLANVKNCQRGKVCGGRASGEAERVHRGLSNFQPFSIGDKK